MYLFQVFSLEFFLIKKYFLKLRLNIFSKFLAETGHKAKRETEQSETLQTGGERSKKSKVTDGRESQLQHKYKKREISADIYAMQYGMT